MGEVVKRILGTSSVHLVLAILIFGAVIFLASDYEDASEQLRLQLNEVDDPEAQVLGYLASAREQLTSWVFTSLGFGWGMSVLFLAIAQRDMPPTRTAGAARKPLWAILLFLSLIFSLGMWWWLLKVPEAGFALLFSNYASLIFGGLIGVFLGYFLGTALFVKTSMKPSVPLAELMKGMR